MDEDDGDAFKPTAIDKALGILDVLIAHPAGLRSADLLKITGFPPGTLHRQLGTLMRNGFVRQDELSGQYRLGYKFLYAFNALVKGLALPEKAPPVLRRLAEATGQAANLAVLQGDQLVVIESIVGETSGTVLYSPPGTLMPVNCTAMGKVLLADLPAAELQRFLQSTTLVSRTPHSITDPARLTQHLTRVRDDGYAIDEQEFNVGVRCIAAPIRNHSGRVVAAVSVTSSIHDLPEPRVPVVVGQVTDAATAISTDLGYNPAYSTALPTPGTAAPA
ncbi:MAG TPA: IclR family transcriptional regulator [Thermomicrobiaceae bacterium]|nr:IclR family transcriptional regulator [Thermomicrobiaceae bacterium]